MRAIVTGLALAVGVLVVPAAAHAADWDLETFRRHATVSQWDGFAPGTTFTTTTKTKDPRRQRTNTRSDTLLKVENDSYTFEFKKSGGRPGSKFFNDKRTEKRKKAVKFDSKDLGKETITVGGTTYACKKVKVTQTEAGFSETFTYWIDPKHGAVQYDWHTREGRVMRRQATKLSVAKKVGNFTFQCREYTTTFEGGKEVLLLALHGPVRALGHRVDWTEGGTAYFRHMEVTAATVKKAKSK